MRRALFTTLLVAIALATATAPAATATAATPRTSLPDVEDEVMCVSCRVPLNIAESPQADRERELIRTLVGQGKTKQQIKDRLVAEYGRDVLAVPDDRGVGVTAYVVPIVVGAVIVGLLALLLPRWRRRGRLPALAPTATTPTVSDAELRRVDEDLRRFD